MSIIPQGTSKDAEAFRAAFIDLLLKYNVSIEVNSGYYPGEFEGVEICVGQKRVVACSSGGTWSVLE